jgi:hypothetical protein
MFGPLEEELGGHQFNDDDDVETLLRKLLQTRPDSFFDDRIKKSSDSVEKCVKKKEIV